MPEDAAREIVCGADPERYIAKINEYVIEVYVFRRSSTCRAATP
jgi:hypothetical protein